MTLTTLLPYIPPHHPRRRPQAKSRICFGTFRGTRPSPEVHECPWCAHRLLAGVWPKGAEWVAYPFAGKIIVLGPAWIQRIWDEAEARVEGVWI